MPMTQDDLAVDFFPQVGFASTEARHAIWQQYILAAGALAQLGAGWGDPASTDHTQLRWSDEDAGWLAHGSGPLGDVIGWLDFGGASIWLERREPQEGAWIELEGKSPAEIAGWIRATSERLSGAPPRGDAPGSSDSAVPLTFDDADARADLESLYEGAGLMLTALRSAVDPDLGEESSPVLDPRTLRGTCRLTGGTSVSLLAPTTSDTAGSWCVDAPNTGPPVRLSLSEFGHHQDGESQRAKIAGFIATSLNIEG